MQPRQLLTGFVANPRPTGSPLMTWGCTLKKALIKCGSSPSLAVWRQAAADRMFWRQMCGQFAPPPALSRQETQANLQEHLRPPTPSWHSSRPAHHLGTPPTPDPVLKERPKAPSSRRRVTAVGGSGARIAVLGSDNLDPGAYHTARPCGTASLQRNLGLCRGLKYTRCTSTAVA